MTQPARVTVTLPAALIDGIAQYASNRSAFVAEAVARELERLRREDLLRSLCAPHPDAAEFVDLGLDDWMGTMSSDAEDLVDPAGGRSVQWAEGRGWREEER
jgi:hypothetical protein